MLPTLNGRIQSRIFFLAVIGAPITVLMSAILPAEGAPFHTKLKAAFIVLATVAVLGVVWELIYHLLMQWRWEKDWPTFFGLATFLNEGIVVYLLAHNDKLPGSIGNVPFWFFWIDFLVIWLAIWVWVNGPMRVFNIHWRFFGGRLV